CSLILEVEDLFRLRTPPRDQPPKRVADRAVVEMFSWTCDHHKKEPASKPWDKMRSFEQKQAENPPHIRHLPDKQEKRVSKLQGLERLEKYCSRDRLCGP